MIENVSVPRPADPALARCADLPPGPEVLLALSALDPDRLSEADRITTVQLYERAEAAVSAAKQRVLAAIARGAQADPDEWVREDLACALRIAPATAHQRLLVAATLLGRALATFALLAAGRLPFPHAALLARAVADLPAEQAAAVERRVLRTAEGQTYGSFRRSLERAVLATDPRTAEERRRDAVRARRAWTRAVEDGMAILGAVVPQERAAVAWQALTAMAEADDDRDRPAGDVRDGPEDDRDREPGRRRTLDQRRADHFVDLLAGRETVTPVRTHVEVLVSAETLLGTSGEPGRLAGFGLLDPAAARELAFVAGAGWTRLVVGYDGELLGHDRGYAAGDQTALLTTPFVPPPGRVDRYRPTAAQQRFARARDRECVFPVCRRDAQGCETDHTLSRSAGGETEPPNLRPLCKRHHQTKTAGRWHLRANADGTLTWTSRHRRRYRTGPTDLHDP